VQFRNNVSSLAIRQRVSRSLAHRVTKNWAKIRAYALLKKTPTEECNDAAFNRQRFPTRVAGLL
ncbi:hypothetical protein, partial [Klebsiella pneumoniae]|uniref:hypothetical protein n=1 Tax=Klebsiella pneumoniae TaxID=573 RepID=UPI001954E088